MSTNHDYFDKTTNDVIVAQEECRRTYALWQAARERLKRLERKRDEAFEELLQKMSG